MKVGIVEDDALKLGTLCEFLEKKYPDLVVRNYRSYNSGLKGIVADNPDILLLDMTLPTFDRTPAGREGRFRPLGGYDMIRKIHLLRLPIKVIIVSQLEAFGEGVEQVSLNEITDRCSSEFPELFAGSVYYHPTSSEWESPLLQLLNNVTSGV